MKYLLILTVMHLNGVSEVSRIDYSTIKEMNIVTCMDYGRQWSNWYMGHIPDILTISYECIQKEYGN